MPDYPKAGVSLELDMSDYSASMDKALTEAKQFPDTIETKLTADDAEIKSLLDLDAQDLKINVDDAELKTAAGIVSDLDAAAPDVKVNADDSELAAIQDQLRDIAAIGVIDLAVNVAGGAIEFVQGLGRFSGIGGVLEMDTALATLEARTGRLIPQAEQLIEDIYTNGWGESREQIAGVSAEATKLKIANEDLGTAVENALIIQTVYGEETNETLRTMDSMVKNNLAPDFQAAADIITAGLQTGANRGQDLLDTFNEYGSTFGSLRISGEGALALINSGLDAGIDNSDRIADAIRETGIRLGEIGTNPAIKDAFSQLDKLSEVDLAGLLNAYNAGEISGDDFFGGFFQALEDATNSNPEQAQILAATLVGTIAEDFSVEAISQLDPVWDEAMGSLEGRTETAGETISDTLAFTFETFFREIDQAAADLLSSDSINLDEKIDTLKSQLRSTLDAIGEGEGLADAIEIGFNLTGFADSVARFEAGVGNFLISVLELIAGVQDFLGKDSSGTRAQIAQLAENQLAFNLQVANTDEIGGEIATAINRGVDPEAIVGAVTTSVGELLDAGDFEQAQNLLDSLSQFGGAILEVGGLVNQTVTAPIRPELDQEAYEEWVQEFAAQVTNETGAPVKITFTDIDANTINELQQQVDDALQTLTGGIELFDPAAFTVETNSFNNLMSDTLLQGIPTSFSEVTQAATDAQSAINAMALTTEDVAEAAANATAENAVKDWFGEMALAAIAADQGITEATTGNTITTSIAAVQESADAHFPPVIRWFELATEKVLELDAASLRLPALAGFIASLADSIRKFPYDRLESIVNLSSGYAGAGNIVNNDTIINVNQTNNVSNGAQGAATTYQIAQAIGGG